MDTAFSLPGIFKGNTSPSVAESTRAVSCQLDGASNECASGNGDTAALSDEAREEAIRRAGQAVEKHMATWQAEGCFAARGMADRAMQAMHALIRGRSAEQVARMEQERGLGA